MRHVHLSVGPDPSTEMIVSFASIPSKYPHDRPVAGVIYGVSPAHLKTLVLEQEDSPTFYNLTSIHGGNYGKDYYSPYYHHIILSGLQPQTTYYYKPIIQTSLEGFQEYYDLHPPSTVATSGGNQGNNNNVTTGTILSKDQAEEALLYADHEAQSKNADDDATTPDQGRRKINQQQRQIRNLSSQRRFLWDPYDARQHDCPSPEKIRSFTTAPVPGSFPIHLAIIGDIGQFPHSEESLARMLRERSQNSQMIHAVLLAGDIAYSNEDHRRWDTFFDFLDDYPIAEHVPLQIVPGNHDIDKEDSGKEIFIAYEKRFRMPRVHPPQLGLYEGPEGALNMDKPPYPLPYEFGNAYYSFTYGAARVLMISSYSSMEPNSTQYRWILSELEAVDRTVTPWVLAVLHCPMYNTFGLHMRDQNMLAGRQHLEPLFVKHRVNLVLTGHIHAYLRTCAVIDDVPSPLGPVHITVGSGGRKCKAPFKSATPEPWVQVRDSTIYGYGMLRLLNRTHAVWDWIHTGHADDRNFNEIYHSEATLPPGPGRDVVTLQNQYFL